MKIVIASGKGGTGKTTVASALLASWPRKVIGVDLDVEAPNLHLFLKPEITGKSDAYIRVPRIDLGRCTFCGACADLCQFKAISVLGEVVMTFPEMCHGCGGCLAVCPEGAIGEGKRSLGKILWGNWKRGDFLMGDLRVGEAMGPALMREVKRKLFGMLEGTDADVVADAPPGVSCPAISAVMDSDMIVLVTEPTPFGLYDLKLAHMAFSPMRKPMGLVINRAGLGDENVYIFAKREKLPILAEIPHDQGIARMYARGQIIAEYSSEIGETFRRLADRILSMTQSDQMIPSEVA